MAGEIFTIGRLARETGCKIQTIRYYEQIGLIPAPPRSEGNQRLFGRDYVGRLTFIRHSRELGFPLEAIRDLLSLADDPVQPCGAADQIARTHLATVETRIGRLTVLKAELERMIEQCSGGRISDCRVIDVLADHSRCLTEAHQPLR